jgi:2-hydroxy-3-keto-5-methylthiopentenyl-1-phosphate phosphatase
MINYSMTDIEAEIEMLFLALQLSKYVKQNKNISVNSFDIFRSIVQTIRKYEKKENKQE